MMHLGVSNRNHRHRAWQLAWYALSLVLPAAPAFAKMPVVPKWQCFEHVFKSSRTYANPLQEVTLTVQFVSPLGETNEVFGFWDGGRIWRVRFAPDELGGWTFRTSCSDSANDGLHNQTGEFLCTTPVGLSRFSQHGPVRVARDHRHFEHADGTPFFWLADTVWNGARVSRPLDWERYAVVRASQGFTVAQWTVAPGPDLKEQSAITGFADRIGVDPEFFQRLDAKLEVLSRSGLLSAIVPLSELAADRGPGLGLKEDQAALFVRYVVARWGAQPVAWLLAFDAGGQPNTAERWKKIGCEVFGGGQHAPAIVYPGQSFWLADSFLDQSWMDALAFETVTNFTDAALKWTFTGPPAKEWTRSPARPLLTFTPCENGLVPHSQKRFTSDEVRHAAYWGLFLSPPAGISYRGEAVFNWDESVGSGNDRSPAARLPFWYKALFMPAAKQVGYLANFMDSIDFWRLRPAPGAVAAQPGDQSPQREITAATSPSKDLALAYVPQDRTIELSTEALPPSPTVSWFDPRAGDESHAVAVVSGSACQFPTPGPGDWLLVGKPGK